MFRVALGGPYIHLKKETEHVIVDTKFYREALQTYHGKSSIHSEHLYQLFSYLKNAEALGDEYSRAKGVLLYHKMLRNALKRFGMLWQE